MKVVELLTLVKANYPTAIQDGTLIHYINMLEDTIYSDIVGTLDIEPLTTGDPPIAREQYKPDKKTFELMHTQELALTDMGDRWAELYEYYLYSRMALLNKDFEDYQNYASVYNALHDDFVAFYFSRRSTPRVNWR